MKRRLATHYPHSDQALSLFSCVTCVYRSSILCERKAIYDSLVCVLVFLVSIIGETVKLVLRKNNIQTDILLPQPSSTVCLMICL